MSFMTSHLLGCRFRRRPRAGCVQPEVGLHGLRRWRSGSYDRRGSARPVLSSVADGGRPAECAPAYDGMRKGERCSAPSQGWL